MRAIHGLRFAAAPTFAVMAVVTQAFNSGVAAMMCTPFSQAFPIDGMALMYALMSIFHLGPWLKRISPPHTV